MKRAKRKVAPVAGELFAVERVTPVRELAAPCDLMVLTSDEELVRWSRRRVIEVLVREAELDPKRAGQVAERVEKQLLASGLRAVSTSLVRELVGAELVSAGLAAHHVRHARIGVSLYDAGRILRGAQLAPSTDAAPTAFDPEATTQILARRIKRDYALTGVFSSPVADAHRTGDIHIHDLETIDRPESLWLSVANRERRTPPRDAQALAAATAQEVAVLLRHVGSYIGLEDPFGGLASRVEGERAARDLGRHLLRELASLPPAGGQPQVVVGLRWDGGAVGRLARSEHADLARRAALAYVEAAAVASEPRRLPALESVIGPGFFATTGHLRFLEATLAAAARGVEVRLVFARAASRPPRRTARRSTRAAAEVSRPVRVPPPGAARACVLGSVSVDLPRLGYRGGADPEMVEARLSKTLEIAARAHIEKRVFVEDLLARGRSGPLAALIDDGDGTPRLRLDASRHLILPAGLSELAELVVGSPLHQSAAALAFGLRFLQRMRRMVDALARRHKLPIALALEPCREPATRFAKLDLRYHSPIAGHHVRGELRTGDVSYTPGAGLDALSGMAPFTRLQHEGRLHEVAPTDAATRLPLAALGSRVETAAQMVMEIFAKTSCHELRLVP